ncbi:MAG: glycosyltransferase [Spirochaetaceae bacterium]|nr:glycosyltransferase [Spirochaetaceae bacterium]
MNILFDFISMQDTFINGGTEYTKVIFNSLLQQTNVIIFGLYNKEEIIPEELKSTIDNNKILLVDIHEDINSFIQKNDIDIVYIAIGQRYAFYDLSSISCKVYLTIHDVGDLSQLYDGMINSKERYIFEQLYVASSKLKSQFKMKLQRQYHKFFKQRVVKKAYGNIAKLVKQENVFLITVSEYTKYALLYFFDGIQNEIKVFAPPHKSIPQNLPIIIENPKLKKLIEQQKKYFLLLSCTRRNKNAALFFEQWERFLSYAGNDYIVLACGNISLSGKNIEVIPFLSDSDLEIAYKNAFALVYPSISEGYGYPPMEAMKYGTPVVCSNVTSLPEVYQDSVISFSPFYPEDLFRALILCSQKYEDYKKKSLTTFTRLMKKQENDLQALIRYILDA